jgi:dihydroorotate dehydrogenase (NAD+) catalytic subunit
MSLMLSSGKQDIIINRPIMNSAGLLGFSDELRHWLDLQTLGAFLTNPISLYPRTPAHGLSAASGLQGALLHTGLPNPGLDQVIKIHQARWKRMPVPVVLHLIAQTGDEMMAIVDRLEGLDSVQAIEIGLLDENRALDTEIFLAARAGILPVIIRLPLNTHIERLHHFDELGATAITLGPPRGTLFEQGERVCGRLYSPTLAPQIMRSVEQSVGFLSCPLIAGAGIFNRADAERLLSLGAHALQVDTILWTDPHSLLNPTLTFT